MNLFQDVSIPQLFSTLIYCAFGLVLFMVAYFIIEKMTPFSVRKEIEEDQNTALGVIIGSMMIGLAIIIASAIASPSDVKPPKGRMMPPPPPKAEKQFPETQNP